MGLSYTSVAYEDGIMFGYFDYDVSTVSARYSHNWRESTDITATLYGNRFETEDIDNTTDSYGITFGFVYEDTESLEWEIEAGLRRSVFKSIFLPDNEVKDNGYVLDFSLLKKFEYTRWNMSLNHSLLPSSSGRLLEQNKIVLNNTYEITHAVNSKLNLVLLRNDQVLQNTTGKLNRDYYSALVGLRWRMMENWYLDGDYNYRYNKYDNNPDSATSNAVHFTISNYGR